MIGGGQADSTLSKIYQILSPQVLLKKQSHIDTNTLNKRFYDELLHILGLKEIEQNGKRLITQSDVKNSLSHRIRVAFPNLGDEEVWELIILWNNRILFLALLESMLLSFSHIKEPFLDKITDFSTLDMLFFEVLAKRENERDSNEFSFIPYLNSSLFDKSALEENGHRIKLLESSHLSLFPQSVLKDTGQDTLPILEYLFGFLHAYDFTTTPKDLKDGIKQNFDKLINPSVLGLVFEKLNGYKEGSFYTPSTITSYMCKESIRKIVIDRFNEANVAWNAKSLKDIESEIRAEIRNREQSESEIKEKYKKILLSIRICDPSVGSGHFLVSALNEMVYITFALGLLESNITNLAIENDEIIIRQGDKVFAYQKPSDQDCPNHQIQKELFNLKRQIIESCLFGVDINPNSVEITKLRLWIELLKYSYYTFEGGTNTLQTLPNIDINIKCGNSLIYNLPLDSQISWLLTGEFSQNLRVAIDEYKKQVDLYKNALSNKAKILQNINNLKAMIKKHLIDINPISNKINANLRKFVENYGYRWLDTETTFGLEMIKLARKNRYFYNPSNTMRDISTPLDKKGQNLLDIIYKDFETIESIKNTDTFEWRFEFPEVLDSDGNFVGFDLAIGNPPYIDYRKIDKHTKSHLYKKSNIYKITATGSIYVYFIEVARNLIRKDGYFIFINPIGYICQDSGDGLRQFIDANLSLISMIDISNVKVFDSASAYTCINYFKHKDKKVNAINFSKIDDEKSLNLVTFKNIPKTNIENISVLLDSITTKIFNAEYPRLLDFCSVFCGLSIAGFRADVSDVKLPNSVSFLEASDILRYGFNDNKFLTKISSYYTKDKIEIFYNDEIIFMARMTNIIRCCIAPKGYFGGKVNCLYQFKIDRRIILGILNSRLMNYFYTKKYFASHMQGGAFGFDTSSVGKLPIPYIDSTNKNLADEIIALVDRILESKSKDSTFDTKELEFKIDNLVYQLYALDSKEIAIIESPKDSAIMRYQSIEEIK